MSALNTNARPAPDRELVDIADYVHDYAISDRKALDALREKTTIIENPRYSRDFYDPEKRSSSNAVQVFFTDGTSTPKVEAEYPIVHPRRRSEVMPVLKQKLEASLARRYPLLQKSRILRLIDDTETFERAAVHEFVDMLVI